MRNDGRAKQEPTTARFFHSKGSSLMDEAESTTRWTFGHEYSIAANFQ